MLSRLYVLDLDLRARHVDGTRRRQLESLQVRCAHHFTDLQWLRCFGDGERCGFMCEWWRLAARRDLRHRHGFDGRIRPAGGGRRRCSMCLRCTGGRCRFGTRIGDRAAAFGDIAAPDELHLHRLVLGLPLRQHHEVHVHQPQQQTDQQEVQEHVERAHADAQATFLGLARRPVLPE
ncbi:hypothetical protein [Thermomonas sp. HDW16]|uniref:hypothetical protein n=1 Tax=Thermomonas sp. HDW16 TaxID=2714945 RepID=UPI00140DAEF4|nr:hypothetical protein [Thermomonas sp. HDW16]QIL20576.1 hypothetical protein G7079_07405 [Thermomonas sp. HDW16]